MMVSRNFESLFEETLSRCKVLTRNQAKRFIEKGYVVVKSAFSREFADEVCQSAWRELRQKHNIEENDPDTWHRGSNGRGMSGYIRIQGTDRRIELRSDAC